MIDAIIFDIGNVLLLFDYDRALRRIQPLCEVDLSAANHQVRSEIESLKIIYESGGIDRAEFLRRLREILRYRGADEELVAAWEDIFDENFPMTKLAEALGKRLPLYLLSNAGDIHIDFVFRKFSFFRHFRGGVYSYRARSFKPAPAIFEMAISDFGVDPAKTLYIDDLAPNVAAAAECGLRALQYDFRHHDDFLRALVAHGGALAETR